MLLTREQIPPDLIEFFEPADCGECYVCHMVAVFREVRRVLRRDGTCWLNIGDSYNTYNGNRGPSASISAAADVARNETARGLTTSGLKPKDLVGIPWRLAFALQADGWYLRSDIIWAKPNPMPESVTDRPTKAHEYLFLLTRSPRYFYDADAIREKWADWRGGDPYPNGNRPEQGTYKDVRNDSGITPAPKQGGARGPDGRRKTSVQGADGSIQHRDGERWPNGGRNRRSVWEIAKEPYPDAHFATFPQALVEPCILAGTSERGCCPECGAPWERETDVSYEKPATGGSNQPPQRRETSLVDPATRTDLTVRLTKKVQTTGWRPTCEHGHEPIPCTVLDPFMGSGTTALVARRLGRRSLGIELSEEYASLAAGRLQQLSLLATEATA